MILTPTFFRSSLFAGLAAVVAMGAAQADPARIVLQNGRAVDISVLAIQGDNFVVKTSTDGFAAGQTFPVATADHVYADKPATLNAGIALVLTGDPRGGLRVLEPILESQKVTARVPGNFWLEAARASLVAYALSGEPTKCNEIGKEISDATLEPGSDPFVALGKALLLPSTTPVKARDTAFTDLAANNLPSEVCAYASIFRANALKAAKRDKEALEAYLSVSCLYPAGGLVLNAVSELNASEILTAMSRRDEAVALLNSALISAKGTSVAAEVSRRLKSTQDTPTTP